ncbi:MAG TPA: hypothetical protein DCY89_06490 [Gammaproteobacteria bacterium]|nr:hypothetical protein [Gammaproteobacteria bacterium]
MTPVIVLVLLATLLPLLCAAVAKFGFDGYDNRDPRAWLARQTGFRARAQAAQENSWEALTLYLPGAALAIGREAEPETLAGLAGVFLAARLLYLICYVTDRATMRSIIWLVGLLATFGMYLVAL